MLSRIQRLLNRNSRSNLAARRRRLGRSLEQLEQRQLLTADLGLSTLYPNTPQTDGLYAMAADANGDLYVSGWQNWDSSDPDFISKSFVSKRSQDGTVLWEQGGLPYANELEVDSNGLVYLFSRVQEAGLPVTSDAVKSELSGNSDYYLAVLDSNQIQIENDPNTLSSQELVYATYLGGSADESWIPRNGLTIDNAGAIYVSGETESTDFPTTNNAFADQTYNGGNSDGFISKFSPIVGGDYQLTFSTYWGGEASDRVTDLALDADGVLHASGITGSNDFVTTPDAYLSGSTNNVTQVFLSRLSGDGELLYSTYFGGVPFFSVDISVDETGATYLAGQVQKNNVSTFPVTANAYQNEFSTEPFGEKDAYLSKFNSDGQLEFSTLYGGSDEEGFNVRVEVANGQPILIGTTMSPDLPVQDAFQGYGGAGPYNTGDTYVAKFSEDGSELLFATYLGGSGDDYPAQIVATPDNEVWIAGYSYPATGFLTTDGSTAQGDADGFLTRISFDQSGNTDPLLTVGNVTVQEGNAGTTSAEFSLTLAEALTESVSVSYSTFPQSAVAGIDFINGSGELTIPAGQTSGTVSVQIIGDTEIENDETFALLLSSPQGVRLSQTSPTGTIVNDDPGALDDMENGFQGGVGAWLGPWQLGNQSYFTNEDGPAEGILHARVGGRESFMRRVDTAGVSNLNLAFASKLRSFENNDNAYVRVSADGSNWTTLKTFSNGEDDNTYRDYSFDIPFEADELWIDFQGDMSSSRWDYWYVDTVAVTGVIASQPPVAVGDSGSTAEDQAVTIDVLANDSDPEGDALSILSVTQPAAGSAAVVAGQVQYTPDADFNGIDSFTYTITDTAGQTATASVDVTITPVNDAPVSVDDTVTTSEDTPVTFNVLGNDSDVDGDSLNVASATNGSSGTVTVNADNTLTYSPSDGFFGSDQFTYTISDGNGGSDTANVLVTVEEQNDPPLAVDDTGSTAEDIMLLIDVLANDSDPDGDTLSIQSVSDPASGTAAIAGGKIEYTPGANFNGSDSFTYTIVDTAGQPATATVNVTVTPVNDAPVATGDSYSLDQDSTLTIDAPGVLANDSDVDGDTLTAAVVSVPASGSLTLNADGSFVYTPDAGFVGTDSFTYQAVDTSGAVSEPVTVSLQVNAIVTGPKLSHGELFSVTNSWQTVSLDHSYNSAVIVATPRYNPGSGPGVVRISNVTATSFDVRVDNPGSSPFSGGVHFIAMEEGVYDVPGAYKLEAVKVDASSTSRRGGWQIGSQGYQQSYSNPVVVGQVMSTNDEDWSVFWSSSSSRTSPANSGSLNVGKHVGEDTDRTRATETLGYFVIESTSGGTIGGLPFTAGVGSDTIRGVGNGTYRYGNATPAGAATAVLTTAGMDGGDGGWAALMGSNPLSANGGSIDLSVDEDQVRDSERKHTTEQVAYFVIGASVGEGEPIGFATAPRPEITIHNPLDVNGDGFTSPIDALQVINSLNAAFREEGDLALDTSGDGRVSALDALLVINRLNALDEDAAIASSSRNIRAVDGYFGELEDEDEEADLFGLRLA